MRCVSHDSVGVIWLIGKNELIVFYNQKNNLNENEFYYEKKTRDKIILKELFGVNFAGGIFRGVILLNGKFPGGNFLGENFFGRTIFLEGFVKSFKLKI